LAKTDDDVNLLNRSHFPDEPDVQVEGQMNQCDPVWDTPNANIPVWWVLMRDLIVASFFSLRMKLQGTFFF
jgi:hypothetical protein